MFVVLGVVFMVMFVFGILFVCMFVDDVDFDLDCVLFGFVVRVYCIGGVLDVVLLNGGVLFVNVLFVILFYKEFWISVFDFSMVILFGIYVWIVYYVLMVVIVGMVVGVFESVGVILVIVMLIGFVVIV